ncbi:MAG: hypothetical protein HWE34_11945 [Methylocystaceae bacterium]|nr:hypothetical protein [Methylocystaceae bacterium]
MTDMIKLPQLETVCPKCHQTMKPTRATRGGGWGGNGLRFLYVCEGCDHKVLLENEATRSIIAIAALVLIGVGLVGGIMMSPPSNVLFAVVFGGLGAAFFWAYYSGKRKYPVDQAHQASEPTSVDIEQDIFLSEEEQAHHKRMERQVTWFIWLVLAGVALLLLTSLYEWVMS